MLAGKQQPGEAELPREKYLLATAASEPPKPTATGIWCIRDKVLTGFLILLPLPLMLRSHSHLKFIPQESPLPLSSPITPSFPSEPLQTAKQ